MAQVRFRGVKTARRNLGRSMGKISRAGDDRSREICEHIVHLIATSSGTPYDSRAESDTTGAHLRDSYRVVRHPAGDGWLITTDRRYWMFVEFGTRKMDAQPHIRPAIENARQVFGL